MSGPGTVGRPSKPASLHLLANNPSKKPMGALLDETLRVPVDIPELPDFLRFGGAGPDVAIEARAEWERITPHLKSLGLISHIDRAALVAYCLNWGRWVHAERRLIELGDAGYIESTPSGYKQMGVWLQIASRALASMNTFLQHFGLSPAARARVTPGDGQMPLPGMDKPSEGGWGQFKKSTA